MRFPCCEVHADVISAFILRLSHATVRRCTGRHTHTPANARIRRSRIVVGRIRSPRLGLCLSTPSSVTCDGTDWCTTAVATAAVVATAVLNGKRFNAIIYHFSHNNRRARSVCWRARGPRSAFNVHIAQAHTHTHTQSGTGSEINILCT